MEEKIYYKLKIGKNSVASWDFPTYESAHEAATNLYPPVPFEILKRTTTINEKVVHP